MNTTLKTILIVLAVVVIAAGLLFAGFAVGRSAAFLRRAASTAYGLRPGVYGFGPGMMGRAAGGMGPGMMDDWRGGYGFGPGMMGRFGQRGARAAWGTPLSIEQARKAAQTYVDALGIDGLKTGEIMIFDNHAYVIVLESATGLGAFELLVDPVSGLAYPEHGPNMMWNLKYAGINHQGMMGQRGMMDLWGSQRTAPGDVSSEMPVTAEQARTAAQEFLDQQDAGTAVVTPPVQFYGYYTFDVERNGSVEGMLSVNGYTRQVFPHVWHGEFLEEAE